MSRKSHKRRNEEWAFIRSLEAKWMTKSEIEKEVRNRRKKSKSVGASVNKPKGFQDSSYAEYLRSSGWLERRNRKLRSVGNKCEQCGKIEELQIHHKHYRTLGRERNRDLRVLCKGCHHLQHESAISANNHLSSIARTR